jgi:hypothetical protein
VNQANKTKFKCGITEPFIFESAMIDFSNSFDVLLIDCSKLWVSSVMKLPILGANILTLTYDFCHIAMDC